MDLNSSFLNEGVGVIVCADDFGSSSDTNDAIIKLLEYKRISSVSCLVTGKEWEKGCGVLRKYRGIVDIGLHLSYEEMPFNQILKLMYTGKLCRKSVFEKFKLQLNAFMESMGTPPDYIDGHQYIHQLPIFRSALMDLIDMAGFERIYIRNSASSLNDILVRKISILKNMFIAFPGFLFKKDLIYKRIPTNNDFLGIYDFNVPQDPQEIFEGLLRTIKKTNTIFVSHPSYGRGILDGSSKFFDKYRAEEFKYFLSDRYKHTLEECKLYLTRFTYKIIDP